MSQLTNADKKAIQSLIELKKTALGSYSAVSHFLGISSATVSQIVDNTYKTKGDEMWLKIGQKLGWKPAVENGEWKIAETSDYKSIFKVIADAKNNSLFLPISDLAGIGKSAPLKDIADKLQQQNVFYIRCWDWGKREFLDNLCRCLGIDAGRGFKTPNQLIQLVIDFFKSRSPYKPLLIVDEGDKLKGSALRFFISLYNECEDMLGVIIAGTENLEKEIKRGVKYQVKGYDEIDSRFGRRYIRLIGCTLKDATAICQLNGLSDAQVISELFEQCSPIRKAIQTGGRESVIRVITDQRRLKRLVKRELIKNSSL
jgi:hypothetical protein